MDFNPNQDAIGASAITFTQPATYVWAIVGASHFSYVNPCNANVFGQQNHNLGWHVTTQVTGYNRNNRIHIHDFLSDMNINQY